MSSFEAVVDVWVDWLQLKDFVGPALIMANDYCDAIVAFAHLTFSLSVSLGFKMDFYALPWMSSFLACPHYIKYVAWDVFD